MYDKEYYIQKQKGQLGNSFIKKLIHNSSLSLHNHTVPDGYSLIFRTKRFRITEKLFFHRKIITQFLKKQNPADSTMQNPQESQIHYAITFCIAFLIPFVLISSKYAVTPASSP